jgi:hypothetical protein
MKKIAVLFVYQFLFILSVSYVAETKIKEFEDRISKLENNQPKSVIYSGFSIPCITTTNYYTLVACSSNLVEEQK